MARGLAGMEREGGGCDRGGAQAHVGTGGSGESVCVGRGCGISGSLSRRGAGAHGVGLDSFP